MYESNIPIMAVVQKIFQLYCLDLSEVILLYLIPFYCIKRNHYYFWCLRIRFGLHVVHAYFCTLIPKQYARGLKILAP